MLQKINLPDLILDLDDVLLHNPSQTITTQHEFFSKKSFLVSDSYGYHYILPAYISEFLKFATSSFNITFFSGGDEERNRSVVQDIWIKVFNTDKPDTIVVLSRGNLTSAENDSALQGKWYGNKKKDISQVGKLDNTILVDDDQSWALKDQEPNLLKVSGSTLYRLEDLIELHRNKHDDYENSNKTIEECLMDKYGSDDLLAYYKLIYIVGVLDIATKHDAGIINGLYAIQFENDEPKFYDRMRELKYYKRGYRVLSDFFGGTLSQHFPEIEQHFYQ